MKAQCELKAAGMPYPRTCPVCKLGQCHKRPNVYMNSVVEFHGRRDGMNGEDERGEYVAFSVQRDRGGLPLFVKISVSQAETLARDILKNT